MINTTQPYIFHFRDKKVSCIWSLLASKKSLGGFCKVSDPKKPMVPLRLIAMINFWRIFALEKNLYLVIPDFNYEVTDVPFFVGCNQ